ncbi:MAG: acetate--CoA ligase family protein [Nitrospira sp.]|nr:acetate--CoA ligase family protein [Nitrospira sp.]
MPPTSFAASRGHRLLQGYRGHPPADVDAIQDLLLRLSRLVEDVPEIVELDLNPFCPYAGRRLQHRGCEDQKVAGRRPGRRLENCFNWSWVGQ